MIKFFRNIRKKLVSENRSIIRNTNYFKYALGEIVLVVVGILIALQINNWNENRKEEKILKEYLHKISDNVTQDIEQINGLKIRRDTVYARATRSGQALIKRDFSNIKVIFQGRITFVDFYFIPNNSGFDALKNSPFLGKINNTKVDSLLTLYYSLVEKTRDTEESFNNFINYTENQLLTNVDMTPIMIFDNNNRQNDESENLNEYQDLLPYIQHDAFKAAVFRTIGDRTYIRNYTNLVEYGNALIEEIDTFCNRLN
jgi:hypothetical protein